MPRKTRAEVEPEANQPPGVDTNTETPDQASERKYPPYRAIYSGKDFELGEDYRFRQRVFTFAEKPTQEVIDKLKAAGFKYRGAEKAWTIEANPVTRLESERLARELAGQTPEQGVSR